MNKSNQGFGTGINRNNIKKAKTVAINKPKEAFESGDYVARVSVAYITAGYNKETKSFSNSRGLHIEIEAKNKDNKFERINLKDNTIWYIGKNGDTIDSNYSLVEAIANVNGFSLIGGIKDEEGNLYTELEPLETEVKTIEVFGNSKTVEMISGFDSEFTVLLDKIIEVDTVDGKTKRYQKNNINAVADINGMNQDGEDLVQEYNAELDKRAEENDGDTFITVKAKVFKKQTDSKPSREPRGSGSGVKKPRKY